MNASVLLIVVDNLRPELGCYGASPAVTPEIDAFASTAVQFSRTYCALAWCSPSRNSFLTGLRPDRTRTYGFRDDFREANPDAVTLPGLFKNAGYRTIAFGKVFHPGHPKDFDYPASWSEPPIDPRKPPCPGDAMACSFAPGELFDADANTTDRALAELPRLASAPHFLAVGLQSPRLPWVRPAARLV